MIPVPQDRLNDVVFSILKEGIEEVGLGGRTSAEYGVQNIEKGYEARTLAAFVDDLEDPKSLLVVAVGRGPVLDETTAIIYRIWVRPDMRALREGVTLLRDMHETVNAYATQNSCATQTGGSWVFRGSPCIGKMWERFGYEIQEITYVKLLP